LALGFLLRENLILCSSYLPLGVPNWTVIYINTVSHQLTLLNEPFIYMSGLSVSKGRVKEVICNQVRTQNNGVRVPAIVFNYPRHSGATDEGMTNGPLIFAYLVFGPGRTSTKGITRPMKITAWRGPGARLAVQGEDSKEEA
jgi:hypothetical protein